MPHSRSLVDYIETTQSRTPVCACGGSMIPVDHDGALWLECVEHDRSASGIGARLWRIFGHDRRLLFTAEELVA